MTRASSPVSATTVRRRAALGASIAFAWEARALAQTPPGQTSPGGVSPTISAAEALAASGAPAAPDWPRVVKSGETTINFYLPQLDSWDGHRLEAHSAVCIQPSLKAQPVFGVAVLAIDTQVDKGARQVTPERPPPPRG